MSVPSVEHKHLRIISFDKAATRRNSNQSTAKGWFHGTRELAGEANGSSWLEMSLEPVHFVKINEKK